MKTERTTAKPIPFEAFRAAGYLAKHLETAKDGDQIRVASGNRESSIRAGDLRALLLILYPDGKVTL